MTIPSSMLKVMTIVGTRPEIIKLSRVIVELDRSVHHVLVHTGQNYDVELNEIFFQELELRKPDYVLGVAGETLAQTIGTIIIKSDEVMAMERPDALLIFGDTNSCLSVIPAKRRKIPIFHMEAGNRSFDQRIPEELNRKVVDHLSDINMVYTEHSRRYLIAEGLRPEMVFKTGSPMKEVLEHFMPQINASTILERLKLAPRHYFVVSAHREENIDSEKNFQDLLATLNAVAEAYQQPLVVSTHPRTRKKLEQQRVRVMDPLIQWLKPLGLFDYVKLQMHATCVVSDSGTITEEASILNIPAVTIREAHERPEGIDEGTLIMCGLRRDRVLQSIAIVLSQYSEDHQQFRLIADHDTDNVSKKVVRIILSYADYVNRVVWRKNGG